MTRAATTVVVAASALRVDEVRVITCAGEFDRNVGKYDQNMVVFGSRV